MLRRHPSSTRTDTPLPFTTLCRSHYHDFGPTLAAEYLTERHDVRTSRETLRKLMIEAGIRRDRVARRPRPYQPRYRRDCRGERSEEHTSELQSLMSISYAVFCLKKKKDRQKHQTK